ncbi:MAG TPA: ATP-binding protein [Acidimicrobiales bacterium]|nr:ATP-binding protein [Acidimicrobiales bacterium]
MSSLARFPFSAVVGQDEARLALLLAAVDPGIGGVLLRGDKGAAKSTLARGLAGMLPGGAPFVELPLGATEDRVLGTLDIKAALADGATHFRPGLLSAAHGGVLYVDEVNLLPDHLVDVLLDVATSGLNRVERDGVSHSHPARFVLVGSMNPEEGELRPQLLDRFGLSVEIKSPTDPLDRAEVVRRRLTHDAGGRVDGSEGDIVLRARLAASLPADLPDTVVEFACRLALSVGAEGLRADLVLCRAAAAFAGWEGRSVATATDVERVAALALAHRRRRRPFDPPILPTNELERALESARQSFAAANPPAPAADAALETRGEGDAPGEGDAGPPPPDPLADLEAEIDAEAAAAAPPAPAGTEPEPVDAEPEPANGAGSPAGGDEAAPAGDATAGPDDAPAGEPRPGDGTPPGEEAAVGVGAPPEGAAGGGPGTPGAAPAPELPNVPPGTWQSLAAGAFDRPPPSRREVAPADEPPPPPPPPPGTPSWTGEARHGRGGPDGGGRGRAIGAQVPGPGPMGGVALAASVRAAAQRRQDDPGGPLMTVDDLREPVRARTMGRTVVVAVDASGSMGTHRRVEAATGAVLGLLADAYLRRDRVAMVTFRADQAEVVLPPTASVELARTRLAELPTGGVTPLAEGINAGLAIARRAAADGWPPLLVFVTDGRATGNESAMERARDAAAEVAAARLDVIVLDVEDGPNRLGLARELATTMGARHVPVEEISSSRVESAVREALRP